MQQKYLLLTILVRRLKVHCRYSLKAIYFKNRFTTYVLHLSFTKTNKIVPGNNNHPFANIIKMKTLLFSVQIRAIVLMALYILLYCGKCYNQLRKI